MDTKNNKQKGLICETESKVETFSTLGKEIRISPKVKVSKNKSGFSTMYFVETIDVLIGIGKDNTARLIMDVKAWEALKGGASIYIDTLKKFRESLK